jgi:cytochrome P450
MTTVNEQATTYTEEAPAATAERARTAPLVPTPLPPGPRTPALYQMLGLWYRRNAYLERCHARYGDRFTLRLRLPTQTFVVLSDPEDIKAMCMGPADALHAGDGSSELKKYFGHTGLAYFEEEEHLQRRKAVNKATHGEAMKEITASVGEATERHVASWPRDTPIELFPWGLRLTLEVMRRVSFGPQKDPRLDELVEVIAKTMGFNDHFASMLELHLYPPAVERVLAKVPPLGLRRFHRLRARAEEIIYEQIRERRQTGPKGHDLLSVLLQTSNVDGSPLSDIELRDEIMTTFIAGTTTTAAAIAWGVGHLAREDAARRRLVEEIDAGEDDAFATATVYEILRRNPPLPGIIPREVVKPVEVRDAVYAPGVRLWGSAYLVHHDPKIYPDPYSFRPERFLDNPPGTYTWIPFGGGRRRCLGKAIAELEIKRVISEVFRRCEVTAEHASEDTRSYLVAVRPSRGTRVTLTARS